MRKSNMKQKNRVNMIKKKETIPKKIKKKIEEIQKKFDKLNKEYEKQEFIIYPFKPTPFIELIKKLKDRDRVPVVRKGFKIDLLRISPSQKHSHNIKKYIDQRWSAVVLEDVVSNKIPVFLFKGTLPRSLYYLSKKGYCRFFKIKVPREDVELLLVSNFKGEYAYAMTNIFGEDKLTHIQGFLRLFKYKGKTIRPNLITTYDFQTNYFLKIKKEFEIFFKDKKKPSAVIIDGKNNIYRILLRRVINYKRFERLREIFGVNIKENLLDSLADDRAYDEIKKIIDEPKYDKLFSLKDPKKVFQKHKYSVLVEDLFYHLMQAHYKYPSLISLLDFKLDIPPIAKDVYGLYLNYNVIKCNDKKGGTNYLINAQIPFGEIAADMVSLFLTKGVYTIFFYGSAGALNKKYKIGDLLFPCSYYNEKGNLIGTTIKNALADFIKKKKMSGEGIYVDTKHITISTPTKEIIPFIEILVKSGFDEIEVELSPIIETIKRFEETTKKRVNFGAGFVISNIHLTPVTLAEYSIMKPKLILPSEKFVDIIIDYLGITELIGFERKNIEYKTIKKTKKYTIVSSEGKKYKFIFYDLFTEGKKLFLTKLILLKIKLGVPLDHILVTHKVKVIKI